MKTNITILTAVLIMLVSCGDLKTTSYFSQPASRLADYSSIEVHEFSSRTERFPKKALSEIPQRITEKLKTSGLFAEAVRADQSTAPSDETIVLLGEVVEFKSAGDVEYEGGALKFGEVDMTFSVAMVEKGTGEEIASGEISSFSSMGFMQGEVFEDSLYDQIADEIIDFIRQNKR